jgi:hypothetical protein
MDSSNTIQGLRAKIRNIESHSFLSANDIDLENKDNESGIIVFSFGDKGFHLACPDLFEPFTAFKMEGPRTVDSYIEYPDFDTCTDYDLKRYIFENKRNWIRETE